MSQSKRPRIDPALMRGLTLPRTGSRALSRRDLFKYAGAGAGAVSMAAVLAACGGDESDPAGNGGDTSVDPATIYAGQPNGELVFANWPLYLDFAKDQETGERYSPSLRMFEEETGIAVTYAVDINDNASFFGEIQPILANGDTPAYDIIVITNGREFTALTQNEWVWPLDPSKRPNFDANAAKWAKDPTFDPDNKYSMAWQSGLTGIGYIPDKVKGGAITKMDDLADPAKVGQGTVGMLKADMPDFVMINLGIDPISSTPAEWQEAANWLTMQRDSGTVRQYYDQGYADDLKAGNLAASMAWSGDVLYYNIWEGNPMEFVFPEGGALLWIDNMLIPTNASNPLDAMTMMDFYYQPEVAQMVTEWVLYMSPVPATQDLILEHAEEVAADGDESYAGQLEESGTSNYLYPSDEFLERTSFARDLTTDEELEEWDSIFLPISEG
ncbi:MAG: spermidine/putrescine ABC transporter substrate-binding protein [Actinomycetota bacterium]